MRPRRGHTIGFASGLALALASCAHVADREARCAALASDALAGVAIAATAVVTDREDLPGFCQIQGTIDPHIGFEARFPLSSWNGKYYQSGCGGFCGSVLPDKPGFANSINEAL